MSGIVLSFTNTTLLSLVTSPLSWSLLQVRKQVLKEMGTDGEREPPLETRPAYGYLVASRDRDEEEVHCGKEYTPR